MSREDIAWPNVAAITYLLEQSYRYDYPGPIRSLHHRLMVMPPIRHGDQTHVDESLTVTPHAQLAHGIDRFANRIVEIEMPFLAGPLSFTYRSRLERVFSLAPHYLAPCDGLERLHRMPTHLTAPDDRIAAAAERLRGLHSSPVHLARGISDYVFCEMHYAHDATTVFTTAADAFALRTGVCQDYAHVMLAIARAAGLCARYVSGHLHGEGGTHAWVEILVPDAHGTRVYAFDPTHGRDVDLRYVVIATGADYLDVAPTSGSFIAPYAGELTASKRVGIVDLQLRTEITTPE